MSNPREYALRLLERLIWTVEEEDEDAVPDEPAAENNQQAKKKSGVVTSLLTHPESERACYGVEHLPKTHGAAEWEFLVDLHFADALGIRLQQITRSGKYCDTVRRAEFADSWDESDLTHGAEKAPQKNTYTRWVQQSSFHFPEGYALHHHNGLLCLQVQKSGAASAGTKNKPRDPGLAVLSLYVRKNDAERWVYHDQIETTQDDLVRMLIDGHGLQNLPQKEGV